MISFVVPVYNAAAFLDKCVESLRVQKVDLKIILVDDGSTDESGAICDRYAALDSRIRVIHKPNSGPSETRNAGIEAAAGKYIWFIDSDDWIDPDAAEVMLQTAESTQAEITVCGLVNDYVDEHISVPIVPECAGIFRGSAETPQAILSIDRQGLLPFPTNKLFRLSFLRRTNAEFPRCTGPVEDILFQLSCLPQAESIATVDRAFYHYVQINGGSMVRKYFDGLFEIMQDVNAKRRAFYRELGLDSEEAKDVCAMRCVNHLMHSVKNLYRSSTPEVRAQRRPVWRQILRDPQIREDVRRSRDSLTEAKLLHIALRTRSAALANAFFAALMYARLHMEPLYKRVQNRLFLNGNKSR